MACTHPISPSDVLGKNPSPAQQRVGAIPCGQCIGCKVNKSRQWATRMMHEASCHPASSFVTLTYDDEHLPHLGSLEKDAISIFMQRLRDRLRYQAQKLGSTPPPLSYYGCGEYGENFRRPHYHIAIFGTDFPLAEQLHMQPGRYSTLIESIWGNGGHFIGDLTFESAQYVAGYITKKITGKRAKEHYTVVDPSTGELHGIEPEFARMSRNPAIGRRYAEKWRDSLNEHDSVISRGREMAVPRYYDKRLELENPEALEEIKDRRQDTRKGYDKARLEARAIINTARTKLYGNRNFKCDPHRSSPSTTLQ